MNKFVIAFCLVALAAVAVAAQEQGPAASEYDVYSSNGDSNAEDAARPKRTLLLKKKLLLGKAIALKGGLALAGGAALAHKFGGGYGGGYGGSYGYFAPSVHYSYVPAPIHKTVYVSSGYYDHDHHDHHYDHHHGWNSGFYGGHYHHDDDYYHHHGW